MQRFLMLVTCLALAAFVGCGSSSDTQPTAVTKTFEPAQPDLAVYEFLEAVRTGQDDRVASLLTDLARKKTAELDLVVAPPGSDTASFEVGEVEIVSGDGAHVASTWTEINEQGMPEADEIVWILRREPKGWRIAGMAAKAFGSTPVVLNFEDPQDMLRQQEKAEQERIRQQQQQQQDLQARQPDPTNQQRQ